jgi:hypothetical protein
MTWKKMMVFWRKTYDYFSLKLISSSDKKMLRGALIGFTSSAEANLSVMSIK